MQEQSRNRKSRDRVQIQGPHPPKAAFEGQMYHRGVTRLSCFKGFCKCGQEMLLSFGRLQRIHPLDPPQPNIS